MPSRLGLCALLVAASVGAEEQSEGMASYMEFGALMMNADQLNKAQSICTTLFPSQAQVIRGQYEASSLPKYVKAFGFQVPPSLTGDRDKLLETLKKSESEMSSACLEKLPEALNKFDAQYANRAEEWIPAIEKMTAATETFPQPVPQQATPELNSLFGQIVERSNRAYQTGDWSVLAEIYEPGTFDCWRGVPRAEKFGFLSFEPLSEKAKFEVSEYTQYMLGNDFEFSRASPTHLMEIRNELSGPGGRCGREKLERWPTLHFFLVQRGSEFHLTHYCPSKEAVATGQIAEQRPRTAAQATANIALLDAADWEAIAADVKRDRFNSGIEFRLSEKYRISHEEADEVVRYVCDPDHTP
jgi:hypothetical protein